MSSFDRTLCLQMSTVAKDTENLNHGFTTARKGECRVNI